MAIRFHALPTFLRAPLALAAGATLAATAGPVLAQDSTQTVTVTGNAAGTRSQVAGFGDVPLMRSPFAATTLTSAQLQDAGVKGLADITRLDASVGDAYNAEGYWSLFTIRGFVIDPRYNYRRDGLPISAETALALDNKQAVEVLHGTSGIQAGTSAPGGVVNLVVKRPAGRIRAASLDWSEPGSVRAAADIGDSSAGVGWRINAAAEHLDPVVRSSRGERHLLAAAVEWQLGAGTRLEAEVEHSRQSQPSQPGFSLLGTDLPDVHRIDPRLSLNNQPWSLPVVFGGNTGSLRLTQQLTGDWQLVAHGGRQRLRTDDRVAFPYGCGAEGRYDRYCSDGSFDYYDYRSDNEQRDTDVLDLRARGSLATGALTHHLEAGVQRTRFDARLQPRVDDGTVVGTGTIDGASRIATLPALGTVANTDRTERSTQWHLHDRIEFGSSWGLWGGLRHTLLQRASLRTDGTAATSYEQSFSAPWLALSHQLDREHLLYASWGQGVESDVTPNRSNYTNAGQPLPALKSRQVELGIKRGGEQVDWSVDVFDIRRPVSADLCDDNGNCTRAIDGRAVHRGVEAALGWRRGAWSLRGSAQALRARREDSANPAVDGRQPTNVPARTLKTQVIYQVPGLPDLALLTLLSHEGPRKVLEDNSVAIPSWTRVDIGARYVQRAGNSTLVWRAGLDNAADRRAWRESPFEFGHVYLYPLAPRTWHASLSAEF